MLCKCMYVNTELFVDSCLLCIKHSVLSGCTRALWFFITADKYAGRSAFNGVQFECEGWSNHTFRFPLVVLN